MKQMPTIYLHRLSGGHTGPFMLRDPAITSGMAPPALLPHVSTGAKGVPSRKGKTCHVKPWVFCLQSPLLPSAVIQRCQGTTSRHTDSHLILELKPPPSMETPGTACSTHGWLWGPGGWASWKDPRETGIRSLKRASTLFHIKLLAVWKAFFYFF